MRAYFYDKATGKELSENPLHGAKLLAISGNVRRNGEFVPGTCDSVTICKYADMRTIAGERTITAADFPAPVKVKIWSPNPDLCEWRELVAD